MVARLPSQSQPGLLAGRISRGLSRPAKTKPRLTSQVAIDVGYGVINDPDIFRAAKLLIDKHSNDAAIRAAQRADGLLNGGDMDGAAVGRQLVEGLEEVT